MFLLNSSELSFSVVSFTLLNSAKFNVFVSILSIYCQYKFLNVKALNPLNEILTGFNLPIVFVNNNSPPLVFNLLTILPAFKSIVSISISISLYNASFV